MNNKVNNRISTGISPEKIKPFHSSPALTMLHLANSRISIKFNEMQSKVNLLGRVEDLLLMGLVNGVMVMIFHTDNHKNSF